MAELRLFPTIEGAPDLDDFISELCDDLNAEVGPTRFGESRPSAGAKGAEFADIANLVVAILGAPAIVHLIAVLKSYVERNRSLDFTLEGPGGKLRIKAGDASMLNPAVLGDQINAILHSRS